MESSRRTVVVIPAAGTSQRFVEKGFTGHKALLQVTFMQQTQTILEFILNKLPNFVPVLIGVTTPNVEVFEKIAAGRMLSHSQPVTIIDVGPRTDGQAHTILKMLNVSEERNDKVLVTNCDNIFDTDLSILTKILGIADVSMFVHESENPWCSYVDDVPLPVRFAEKDRISQYAMSGAWAFRSGRMLRRAINESLHVDAPAWRGEFYLSQVIQRYPGRKVALPVQAATVLDWGTPESLAATGARIIT